MRAEGESYQVDASDDTGHDPRRGNTYNPACTIIMRHHIQILRCIKGNALRPSEPTHKGLDLTIRRNAINLIRPR